MTSKKQSPAPGAHLEPSVVFHGEQQGGPERQLKSKISDLLLTEPMVQRAYLARIEVVGERGVAMCLYAPGCNEESLVDKISGIFAASFQRNQQLDILFLDVPQLSAINKVCRAFYPVKVTVN